MHPEKRLVLTCFSLFFSMQFTQTQTTPHAAILSSADLMNFVDRWNNSMGGGGNYQNVEPSTLIPESFLANIPYYGVDDYSRFQGTFRGKTLNRTTNRYGDSWLTIGNANYNDQTICVKAGWFNGLGGSLHLEAQLVESSNIFIGEGDLYLDDRPVYNIHLFLFMLNNRRLKGIAVILPNGREGYPQCSTFVLER
jgi:hypothetical protein